MPCRQTYRSLKSTVTATVDQKKTLKKLEHDNTDKQLNNGNIM